MKTNPFSIFAASLALILGHALAIEAPADNSPPPPAAPRADKDPAPRADKDPAPRAAEDPAPRAQADAPAAFLGVVSAELPAVLADHLGLKPGQGVVVQALMPGGPAAAAGVAVHDVITRVGDQPVGSAADLTRLVTGHQPGQDVRIELIHRGKPAGIDVTLGERPAGMAALRPHPLDGLNLDGMPRELADRVRNAIRDNLGNLEMDLAQGAAEAAPHMERAMRDLKERAKALEDLLQDAPAAGRGDAGGGGKPKIQVQHGATVRVMDDQGSVELKSNDGSKEVTIRDKDNQIIWNGPWDTAQDRAAAPDDIRQRVDRLNLDTKFQGGGLRLNLRGADQPDGH